MPDRATASSPLIAGSDIAVAVSIPVLKLVARVLPESAWPRFGRLAARTGPDPAVSRSGDLDTRMRQMLRYASNDSEPAAVLADLRALEIEAVLQTWRAGQRPDWRPRLRLAGTGHLDSALAAGTGAILWVGHFVFASLFAKIALHDAGYEVSHLSHPRHGFSQTRFGMRFLNRGKQEIEAKFLAERVELAPANPAIALRRLQHRLAGNGIVSFTAGIDAARPAFPPFFGDRIALATGAADLAHRSGAPLLPGCATRLQCRTAFRYTGGDHLIFVGEVLAFESHERSPLLFHDGRYTLALQNGDADTPNEARAEWSANNLGYLLGRAYFQLYAHIQPHAQRNGLDDAQYFALAVLILRDGRTLDAINAVFAYSGIETSPAQMQALCTRGLLRASGRGASARYHLTESGRQLTLRIVAAAEAAERDALAGMSEADATALRHLLHRFVRRSRPGRPDQAPATGHNEALG